jgi:hypothetical protein
MQALLKKILDVVINDDDGKLHALEPGLVSKSLQAANLINFSDKKDL